MVFPVLTIAIVTIGVATLVGIMMPAIVVIIAAVSLPGAAAVVAGAAEYAGREADEPCNQQASRKPIE